MSPMLGHPPPTPVESIVDVLHGVSVPDPYRWLEDPTSPRTQQWLEAQMAYTRSYLSAIPFRGRIRKRIEELLSVEVLSAPYRVGDFYFFLKRAAEQAQPSILMRTRREGKEIELVNPKTGASPKPRALNLIHVSRDASLIAYSVRYDGDDSQSIEILDVHRNLVLPDNLPHGYGGGLVFAPDGKGFYYSHSSVDSIDPYRQVLRWHTLGTSRDQDRDVLFLGDDPRLQVSLLPSSNGRQMGICKTSYGDRNSTEFFVKSVLGEAAPQLVVKRIEAKFFPFFSGNNLFALTDLKAPRGRLVSIDLEHPQPENWLDKVPESESSLRRTVVCGKHIYAGYVDNAIARIDVFDHCGKRKGAIPCPPYGTADPLVGDDIDERLFYSYTSFTEPPSIYSYDPTDCYRELWSRQGVPFDGLGIQVKQVRYPSKDGALIPMFLVYSATSKGPLPTFLTGYGGFGHSVTPQFSVFGTFLVEHGCLFAVANLRGGSEFGEEWHSAAKGKKRQTAIDDFIAAAEWLQTNGYAAPGRMAVGGGSNAGLLVGAALTQRPELFNAVVCLGPLLDMLRYHKFDRASSWVAEYGSADHEDDFHRLYAYSPYHQVKHGISYPSVMFISGDADSRCNPLHVRKMTAMLQAATSSPRPILLDYRSKWGHVPVQPLHNRIEALTDRLAFLCQELGLAA